MPKKFLVVTLVATIIFVQTDVQAGAQIIEPKNDQSNAQSNAQSNPQPAPSADPAPVLPPEAEPANLAQVLKPGVAMIPAGTILEFGFIHPLSSATAKVGDDIPLRLLRSLMAGDKTLLAGGTIVHGRVTKANPAGPNCKHGDLDWTLDRISFPDGSSMKISHDFPVADAKTPIPYRNEYVAEKTNWFATTGTYVLMAPLTVIAIAIVAVPFLLYAGPIMLADAISEHRHPSCIAPGKDIDWPATARVGVEVKKAHTVRF